jgi:hypothetical protein
MLVPDGIMGNNDTAIVGVQKDPNGTGASIAFDRNPLVTMSCDQFDVQFDTLTICIDAGRRRWQSKPGIFKVDTVSRKRIVQTSSCFHTCQSPRQVGKQRCIRTMHQSRVCPLASVISLDSVFTAPLYIAAQCFSHTVYLAPPTAIPIDYIILNKLNSTLDSEIAINSHLNKSINSYKMDSTMDTDYELPIPIHRLFITLDAKHDSPLPFRRHLNQVTKLSAETATPYLLPKERSLSRFENLPVELREHVYSYLGIYTTASTWDARDPTDTMTSLLSSDSFDWQNLEAVYGLLSSNRSLRREILNILNSKAVVTFKYTLSDKRIFYDNWHNVYASHRFELGSPTMRRMPMSNSMFQHLCRIRLERYSSSYTIERPHSFAVALKQALGRAAALAQAILFIAEHCPMPISLHVDPCCVRHGRKGVSPVAFGTITSVLRCLVGHLPNLEVVGMCVHATLVLVSTSGDFISSTHGFQAQDLNLELAKVPSYAREDAIQTWCQMSAREAFECDEIVKFVSQDDIEAMNLRFDGWEDMASSSDL